MYRYFHSTNYELFKITKNKPKNLEELNFCLKVGSIDILGILTLNNKVTGGVYDLEMKKFYLLENLRYSHNYKTKEIAKFLLHTDISRLDLKDLSEYFIGLERLCRDDLLEVLLNSKNERKAIEMLKKINFTQNELKNNYHYMYGSGFRVKRFIITNYELEFFRLKNIIIDPSKREFKFLFKYLNYSKKDLHGIKISLSNVEVMRFVLRKFY